MLFNSHLTAISRKKLSSPAKYLYGRSLLVGRVLDFGSGRGNDFTYLKKSGIDIECYDPYYFPFYPVHTYNTIMCNYVLNVIPNKNERIRVLENIRDLLAENGIAYISVRADKSNLKGWTKRGTWQGYIELSLPVVKRTSAFVMYKMELE